MLKVLDAGLDAVDVPRSDLHGSMIRRLSG
jgi:hypothetical protein